MKLYIPGIPQAKQSFRYRTMQARSGKMFVHKHKDPKVAKYEENIKDSVARQLPEGFTPFSTALEVEVTFVFPPLKSWSKKKLAEREAGNIIYKETKPDLQDNLMKNLCDAMEGIVYLKDQQIAKISSRKIFGNRPGITLEINPLEAEEPETINHKSKELFNV